MSGHSKWKTIQHKKGAADAKRGKAFSKLSKEFTIVARTGGGDPAKNPQLRNLIQKARAVNMPADNIDRAIKRGTGEIAGGQLEQVTYEGYAQGGVGVVINVLTDNKNRAVSEIRHIFTKHGANLASLGAVSRGFKRKGQIFVEKENVDENKLLETALNAGAEDMLQDEQQYEILTDPGAVADVAEALQKAGFKVSSSEAALVPDAYLPITDKSVAASILKFLDELEDHDDVQNTYTNADIDDAILAQIAGENS